MNTDQAESGWQQGTSGLPMLDSYDAHQAWYSATVQPNYAHPAPEPGQSQNFQQPGFQVDPAKQVSMDINRLLWPSSTGQDGWQGPGSSWYTAPPVTLAPLNFRGATHFDAASRNSSRVMSTAPVPGSVPCLALKEPFDEDMTNKELVDEDFERDVTKAVNAFLQGGDFDEDDDAEAEGGLSRVPNRRTPAAMGLEVPDVGISWSWADIEPLLDKNMNPVGKEKVKMFCSPENIKELCAKFADFVKMSQAIDPEGGSKATPENLVKLLEILTQDSTSPQKILATGGPPAPASKAPLQLEALLPFQEQVGRSPSTRRTIPPELQRGQHIGLMLKNLPLPPGMTAMHMELLKSKVEDIIKHLIHHQVPPTVSNIQDCLGRQGASIHEVKALWNLCYFYRWIFCLWKPDAGEMSIVLLEEPLPPVDDQTVEQLDMSLANQVVKFIEFQAGPPDGPVPEASTEPAENSGLVELNDQLAQDFADRSLTTLQIRNLPASLQQASVFAELKRCGFEGRYDYFYMPGIFGKEINCGYAFINLIDIETMKEFVATWHNSRRFGVELTLAPALVQGREANAEKFGPRIKRIRNPALKPFIFEPPAEQTA